jgi:hypothetical protein
MYCKSKNGAQACCDALLAMADPLEMQKLKNISRVKVSPPEKRHWLVWACTNPNTAINMNTFKAAVESAGASHTVIRYGTSSKAFTASVKKLRGNFIKTLYQGHAPPEGENESADDSDAEQQPAGGELGNEAADDSDAEQQPAGGELGNESADDSDAEQQPADVELDGEPADDSDAEQQPAEGELGNESAIWCYQCMLHKSANCCHNTSASGALLPSMMTILHHGSRYVAYLMSASRTC